MLGRIFRAAIDELINPLGRALGAAGISANMLTWFGFLVVALASMFIASGRWFLGALVLIGGAVFDTLDGAVARALDQASAAGEFLDSTLDRVSDGLLFAAIAWSLTGDPVPVVGGGGRPYEGLGIALALGCLVAAFMTSYVRAKAEAIGLDGSKGPIQRAERVIILLAGLVFDVMVPALAVLLLLSSITAVQRSWSVYRQATAR